MGKEKSKGQIKWVVILSLALAAMLTPMALKFVQLGQTARKVEAPMKIVTLPDGGKLEILGVSVGNRVIEDKMSKGNATSSIKESGIYGIGGYHVTTESILGAMFDAEYPTTIRIP